MIIFIIISVRSADNSCSINDEIRLRGWPRTSEVSLPDEIVAAIIMFREYITADARSSRTCLALRGLHQAFATRQAHGLFISYS